MSTIKLTADMTKNEFRAAFTENFEYIYLRVKSGKGLKKLSDSKFFTEGSEINIDSDITVEQFEKEATSKTGMEVSIYYETKAKGEKSKFYLARKEDKETSLADLEEKASKMENIFSQKEYMANIINKSVNKSSSTFKIPCCHISNSKRLLSENNIDGEDIKFYLSDESIFGFETGANYTLNDILEGLDIEFDDFDINIDDFYDDSETEFDDFLSQPLEIEHFDFIQNVFKEINDNRLNKYKAKTNDTDQSIVLNDPDDFVHFSCFYLSEDEDNNQDYVDYLNILKNQKVDFIDNLLNEIDYNGAASFDPDNIKILKFGSYFND